MNDRLIDFLICNLKSEALITKWEISINREIGMIFDIGFKKIWRFERMNLVIFTLSIIIFSGIILTVFRGISIGTIFNWEALIIIIGGTSAGLLIGYPLEKLKETFHAVIKSFRFSYEREKTIENILTIARLYKRSEIRSIEKLTRCLDDSFLRLGVTLLINYHRPDDIQGILQREMNKRLISLYTNQNILKTAARLAPSLGLAGTVISLIKMFANMSTAESMMPIMAVALMSTFYGVILSNLLFLPLSAKLRDIADEMEEDMYLITDGIMAIHEGEHPMKIEERLRGGNLTFAIDSNKPVKVSELAKIGA